MSNAVAPDNRSRVNSRSASQAFAAFEQLPAPVREKLTGMALPIDDVEVLEFYLTFGLAKTMMTLEETEQLLLKDWRRLIAEAVAK